MLAVQHADRRAASAVRRFPPGCGRLRNATAQKQPCPLPSSTIEPPVPNPTASAATTSAEPSPMRTVPAAASTGAVGTDGGAGNGREATGEVTVRRSSAARRRYPPGCGRGIAFAVPKPPLLMVEGEGEASASKPPALVVEGEGEASASKPPALVVEGEGEAIASKPPVELCVEAKAKDCDREAVLCECAIDDGEFNSDGGMENGCDAGAQDNGGDAGAEGEDCGNPRVMAGLVAVPSFLPWAQHGRRSQRVKA